MPSYIIKPEPDQDFYVIWSTIVDGPTEWGTRAEVEEHLLAEAARHQAAETAQRFDRADETGSSAHERGNGDWTDSGFTCNWTADGNEGDPRWLPRDNLGQWLRTGDETLLDPIPE